VKVTGSSIVYARVQVYVNQDTDITYTYYPGPFDGLPNLTPQAEANSQA